MDLLSAVATLLLLLIGQGAAQSSSCDKIYNVQPMRTYNIYSPGYPGSYPAGVRCRWTAYCPAGYNCRLDCSEISLPRSESCAVDRLLVSTAGDEQLEDADAYCGRGSMNTMSQGQKITIGLVSSWSSSGGRFVCKLTAQKAQLCNCGMKKNTRIVSGMPTIPNEFPMMAALINLRLNTVLCGATVIDGRHLLTAAHCLYNRPESSIAAVTGMHDVSGGGNVNAKAYNVSKFIIHPLYDKSTRDFDLALVRLQTDIQYNEDVGPVCLPYRYTGEDYTGRTVTILGWGSTSYGGPSSRVLLKANVTVMPASYCKSNVDIFTDRQMCTFTLGKDACQSDSGGPVLFWEAATSRVYQLGIISYGVSCATAAPGVNTRLTLEMLRWIQKNTGERYCEVK